MNNSTGVSIFLLEIVCAGYAIGCGVIGILAYTLGRGVAVGGILTGFLVVAGFVISAAWPIEPRALLFSTETLAINFLMLGTGWAAAGTIACIVGMRLRLSKKPRTRAS